MNTQLTQSTAFLPADYVVPSTADKYYKFEQGDNRFRILSSPILGYEWWVDEADGSRKPHRVPMNQGIPTNEVSDPSEIRHFWFMVVWSYRANRIQILEITQKNIQKTLRELARDEDWGSPVNSYDISIIRTGTTKEDTKYEVLPKPKKPTEQHILDMLIDTPVRLEALYTGGDPFMQEVEIVDSTQLAEDVSTGLTKKGGKKV